MLNKESMLYTPRVACLLLLAVIISILFYWMIKGFLVALLVAVVLAALVHPFCCRLADWLGGRKTLASGATVLLSLVLVIIPLLLFLGILVGQAVSISQSAEGWLNSQMQLPGGLQQQLEADPHLKQLLPYQDEILTKAGELAAKTGTLVAKGLAAAGAERFVSSAAASRLSSQAPPQTSLAGRPGKALTTETSNAAT